MSAGAPPTARAACRLRGEARQEGADECEREQTAMQWGGQPGADWSQPSQPPHARARTPGSTHARSCRPAPHPPLCAVIRAPRGSQMASFSAGAVRSPMRISGSSSPLMWPHACGVWVWVWVGGGGGLLSHLVGLGVGGGRARLSCSPHRPAPGLKARAACRHTGGHSLGTRAREARTWTMPLSCAVSSCQPISSSTSWLTGMREAVVMDAVTLAVAAARRAWGRAQQRRTGSFDSGMSRAGEEKEVPGSAAAPAWPGQLSKHSAAASQLAHSTAADPARVATYTADKRAPRRQARAGSLEPWSPG